jgi:hypothetical protein
MGASAEPEQLVQWFDTPELHDAGRCSRHAESAAVAGSAFRRELASAEPNRWTKEFEDVH